MNTPPSPIKAYAEKCVLGTGEERQGHTAHTPLPKRTGRSRHVPRGWDSNLRPGADEGGCLHVRMRAADGAFLHKVIDGICGRAYPRYQDYSNVWSLSEWMEVLEETMRYFKTAVGKNMSDEEAAQQIIELNSDYQEAITKCLKGRKEEIRTALVENVNEISSAQLQDFDWQLKLALSSDKISMLQMPLLNLDLDVRENGEIKPVSIEMNKEELQNLINALEAANKVVLQLK
ncbi:COMM domain-containing protein 8 [Geospiza fortis]|uniref:COMM domain-containing protein 8 n=1 Tax=Geospiza fortis TaxID=48883 RepID=A0A6I9ZD29_GEOFO|nr:COMM domain-containing protein 8 [Geospiza fortis]